MAPGNLLGVLLLLAFGNAALTHIQQSIERQGRFSDRPALVRANHAASSYSLDSTGYFPPRQPAAPPSSGGSGGPQQPDIGNCLDSTGKPAVVLLPDGTLRCAEEE